MTNSIATTNVIYTKKSTLDWSDLWTEFGMKRDNGGRWYPSAGTPDYAKNYLSNIRTPSRAWPHSYAKAMLSQKFAKLVVEYDPELAVKLDIATVIDVTLQRAA